MARPTPQVAPLYLAAFGPHPYNPSPGGLPVAQTITRPCPMGLVDKPLPLYTWIFLRYLQYRNIPAPAAYHHFNTFVGIENRPLINFEVFFTALMYLSRYETHRRIDLRYFLFTLSYVYLCVFPKWLTHMVYLTPYISLHGPSETCQHLLAALRSSLPRDTSCPAFFPGKVLTGYLRILTLITNSSPPSDSTNLLVLVVADDRDVVEKCCQELWQDLYSH